jgi:(R,R)-butanediol dehydrogenase/meso-butanediol dehydrogenase/diacetyl reductase
LGAKEPWASVSKIFATVEEHERGRERMQALVWRGGDLVEAAEVPTPAHAPGWVLVEPAYVGICGTDLHISHGEHPRALPGLVLGHEIVGRLAGATADLQAGTAVFVNPLLSCGTCRACRRNRAQVCERLRLIGIDVDGGAADLVAVPADHLVALPASLDFRRAALIEPVAVAVRAVRRSGLRVGDRAHVVGAGPIGLLVATCARLGGASSVTFSEPAPQRAEAATAFGFDLVDDAAQDQSADVVFDCTGHPSVSPTVLRWAAAGGTVVTVGAYPGVVGVNLQEVMFRELTIIGTRVYTSEDVTAAVALVAQAMIDVSRLVTNVLPLQDGAEAITRLRAGGELKVLIEGPAAT